MERGGDQYIFPVTRLDLRPEIGSGFDVSKGEVLQSIGIEDGSLGKEENTLDIKANSFYVNNEDNYSLALEFALDAGGSGIGAAYGVVARAGALMKTSSRTQSIHFRGIKTETQATVSHRSRPTDAAKKSTRSIESFFEEYGTHFVAGYVYGKRCNLSCLLKFSSYEQAVAFSGAYKQSAGAVNFNNQLEAKLKAASSKSGTSYTMELDYDFRGFDAGVEGSKNKLDELEKIRLAFFDARASHTPIFCIVRPWSYLETFKHLPSGLKRSGELRDITNKFNKLDFIDRSCDDFQDGHQYVGGTQLAKIRAIQAEARAFKQQIVGQISKGDRIGDRIVPPSPDLEQIWDKMRAALTTFRLQFSVRQPPPDWIIPAPGMIAENPSDHRNNHSVHSPKEGYPLDWTKNSTHLGMVVAPDPGKRDYHVGDVHLRLDSERKRAQMYWLAVDGTNRESEWKEILGSTNSLEHPSDPNGRDHLLPFTFPGTAVTVHLEPI